MRKEMMLRNWSRKFIDVLLKINIGIHLQKSLSKDILDSLPGHSKGVSNVVIKISKLSFS